MKCANSLWVLTFSALFCCPVANGGNPIGTTFTYQGSLKNSGQPANGTFALGFLLYDSADGEAVISGPIVFASQVVTNGLFTVALDFGTAPYTTNSELWLEITVNGTVMSPRQALTPTPHSLSTRGIVVNSTGNVGIGTQQPVSHLHVQQATDTNLSGALVTNSSINRSLHLWVDGSSRGRIDVGSNADSVISLNGAGPGNVGIGTTDPATRLTIQTPSNALGLEHTSGVHRLATQVSNTGGVGGAGRVFIGSVTTADFGILTNNNTRMTVTNSGNVGIGTTTPLGKLHVQSTPTSGFIFNDTGGGYNTYFSMDGIGLTIGHNSANRQLSLQTASLTRMTIDSNGNVGIGTVSPQTKLDVAGVARMDVLEIDGGADISEPFQIGPTQGELQCGYVVCIDPVNPERLMLSTQPYDRKVAGVISGANGVKPGLTLRQEGTSADGEHLVALTGRVYVLCDADTGGAIEPGDLLTTSGTPGHAMKVCDYVRASGAVLGKAMSKLECGRGLVLTLVTLQ